jgi:hypothetical protein
MASPDTEKKAQYKRYSYWMIGIGVLLFLAGYLVQAELFTFFGVIIGGAGILVLLTNL